VQGWRGFGLFALRAIRLQRSAVSKIDKLIADGLQRGSTPLPTALYVCCENIEPTTPW
jgi:hypothetical protein